MPFVNLRMLNYESSVPFVKLQTKQHLGKGKRRKQKGARTSPFFKSFLLTKFTFII